MLENKVTTTTTYSCPTGIEVTKTNMSAFWKMEDEDVDNVAFVVDDVVAVVVAVVLDDDGDDGDDDNDDNGNANNWQL